LEQTGIKFYDFYKRITMPEQTYFETFCEQYRVNEKNNTIKAFVKYPGEPKRTVNAKIFTEDKDGNLDILVYTLDGELISIDNKNATPDKPNINNKRIDFYKVKRFAIPKEVTDKKTGEIKIMKYQFPQGAGTHPFIPPWVRDKFLKKEKIKTLVLTEGYKKAWLAAYYGMDIIGLSSITHYRDKDTAEMYEDVIRIINVCEVENILLLHDGDCLNISIKALEEKKDLYTRPGGFYKAALTVRELFKSYNEKVDFYFSHINSDVHEENPKGLDDLLLCFPNQEKEIIIDLFNYSRRSQYFYRENITTNTSILIKHFSFGDPLIFYLKHQEIIKDKGFVYHGTTYSYDEGKGKLIKKKFAEAADYFRIGDTYYEFVKVPNKYSELEKTFHARQKGTIIDDFGKVILSDVPKYKAFCNIPSHTEYNMIVHNCFNVYAPFTHEPEPGICDISLGFVKHIFEEQYEMGLDYLQLLYQKPTQMLPVLCLVSRDNNTGKSTFVKWLKAIFTQNSTIVGNDQFQDQFNGSWATKLIIACEESFIEKRQIMEKIKQFSTGDKIPLRMMQKDPVEIDFFGKFILCSNNEERFIIAESRDQRFWVRKVSTPKTDNVHMLEALLQEIPYFLHFLNNRKLSTQHEGRMWFNHKLLITEAFKKLAEANKPTIEKELTEQLKSLFLSCKEEILYIPLEYLKNNFLNKFEETYIKQTLILMDIKLYTSQKTGLHCVKKMQIPYINSEGDVLHRCYTGRPYVFERNKFISDLEFLKFSSEVETEE
jgi:hypothetical protein